MRVADFSERGGRILCDVYGTKLPRRFGAATTNAVRALRDLLNQRERDDLPLLMGIVNVTPDSFSDGGRYLDEHSARQRIDELISEGASLIDIGAESTRPSCTPAPADEQVRRLRNAVLHAASRNTVVSVDTSDPDVAEEASRWGASVINDASCLRDGDGLVHVAIRTGLALIIMHARTPMSAMQGFSICANNAYGDIVADIKAEWCAAKDRATRAGMNANDVLFDPGLGFNKNAHHTNEVIARLDEFQSLGHAIVVGPSRKSFLGVRVASEPLRRLGGTVAASLACAQRGASIVRVHDVLEVRQAFAVARDIEAVRSRAAKSRGERSRAMEQSP